MNRFHYLHFGNLPAPDSEIAISEGKATMSTQPWLHTDLVRLKKAVLCANCEVISEGLNGHCAACGSEALLRLNQLLGETAEPALAFEITPALRDTIPAGYLSFVA
jgi:hypothetical protein